MRSFFCAGLVLALTLTATGGCSREPSRRTTPVDGLRYVQIPRGTFLMGSAPGEESQDVILGRAKVTISRSFWISETEVSQRAFRSVMGINPSFFRGDNRPVEQVSWHEAREYCSRVGGRLPTQAEWEYMARAGTQSGRYGQLNEIAWWAGNSQRQTHSVALKQPNAFGVYDALGNVTEWTATLYGGVLKAGTDPQGPTDGPGPSLRGGAWDYPAESVQAWSPAWAGASDRLSTVGFRCVVDRF